MAHWIFSLVLGLAGFSNVASAVPIGFSDLSFKSGTLRARAMWTQGPRTPAESTLRVEWVNGADNTPVDPPGSFKVTAVMPGMCGHGTSPIHIAKALDSQGQPLVGVYDVTKIYFVMGGQWQVQLTLTLPNGQSEMKSIDVDLGGGMSPMLEASMPSAAAPVLSMAGFQAICTDGVRPLPNRRGFWRLNSPSLAYDGRAVFASLEVPGNSEGEYVVVKVSSAQPGAYVEVARFKDLIRDLALHDGKIWVLLADRFVVLDAASGVRLKEVLTTPQPPSSQDAAAHAFTWAGRQLVIAHGTLGMMVYDPALQKITLANNMSLMDGGKQSKAIDVETINASDVVFAIEAVTIAASGLPTFNGLITMNLPSQTLHRYPYDLPSSGSLANATLRVDGDNLWINNWGILQHASLAAVQKDGVVRVTWTPVKFAVDGRSQAGELLGDMIVDGGQIVSCAQVQYADAVTHSVIHKGVVYTGSY